MPSSDTSTAIIDAAAQVEINSENSGNDASPVVSAIDKIAEAVEFATPKGPARSFFAKAKSVRGPALARAYPLHLLLKDDPDGTERLLATHNFPSRKRRPNKANTALIAVIIALNPANDDDHADCSEQAYALQALSDRGVAACDFEREYLATTIAACKTAVRAAKHNAGPAAEPPVEELHAAPIRPSLDSYTDRSFFVTYYVGPDENLRLCKVESPDHLSGLSLAEIPDDEFRAAYLRYLREAQRLASPSFLSEPDEDDTTSPATSATSP